MAVRCLLYSFYLLFAILTKNSNIVSLKVAIISDCNPIFDLSILKSELDKLPDYYNKLGHIDLIALNHLTADENECTTDGNFPMILNSIVNSDYEVIVTSIDTDFCELTRILTLLYKKYVITWSCKSILTTDHDYSNYFIRLTKGYRNGIILLSELLFQMKCRSVVLFVLRNNHIIEDNSSALNFIHGIKRFLFESHIEISRSLILDDKDSNSSLKNFSKLFSPNIKCAIIIGTDFQTPTALRHLKHIHYIMSEEKTVKRVAQIYFSLDSISEQMFKLIEESVNASIGPKLVVIPSLNMSDRHSLMSYSANTNVTNEINNGLYTEIARTLISIGCYLKANDCQNGSESTTHQTINGHTLQNHRNSLQYSVYCINCTKITAITKLDVNYMTYEIDIENLINLPEPDAQCLFDNTDCHLVVNDVKSVNKFIERISMFSKEILVLILCLSSMMVFIYVRIIYRRKREEELILSQIILSSTNLQLNDSNGSSTSTPSSVTSVSKVTWSNKFTAKLQGETVNIKPIIYRPRSRMQSYSNRVELSSRGLRHLLRLRRLKHENVTKFKALIRNTNQMDFLHTFVWEYSSRGTLAYVITKTEIKLDWNFKISLIGDIIRGMTYLHESPVETHGYLNSNNCVIDSRWLLKITNFGINKFREIESLENSDCYELNDLLWFAPEVLRLGQPFWYSSQKADVYSFAIIMQEVLLRDKPYASYSNLSTVDIIENVKYATPLFRPEFVPNEIKSTSEESIPKDVIKLANRCWAENPEDRPSFERLGDEFKKYLGERYLKSEKSLVDTMLLKIERYSTCLEELVEERTNKLEEERKRAENLLYRMLPMSVAESLKNGISVVPEKFDDVTIFFSDIIGFTTIAAYSEPLEVITILNDLYSAFDEIIREFNVYKVETIGDAYMVVSGLPDRNIDHAEEVASMALEILHVCVKFKMRHMPTVPLQLRCGVHSGSVVGGVVGNTNPRYCLFGDAVNIASRLESTSKSYRIHISKSTEEKLRQTGLYITQYRGEITLKGRGKQPTYYLLGKHGFDKALPEPIHNETEGDENHGIQDEQIFTSLGLKKQLF